MWFDGSTAGMMGAIFGCVIGGVGGTMGTLSRIWAAKGKHRKTVTAFLYVFLGAGAILTAIGLAALLGGQPQHVWYIFILTGPLMIVLGIFLKREIGKLFTEAELNKIEISDK